MELRDYGRTLRRFWGTWLGVTLVGVLGALAIVLFSPASYQATAEVFVASTLQSTSGSQFVTQRVASYPDVAVSQTVLEPVIGELGLNDSLTSLSKRVSATNPQATSLIQITVRDSDPQRAAAVANAVAEQFTEVVQHLEQPRDGGSPVSLTLTDPAAPPAGPTFPSPTLLLPLGAVVGLLLGAAAAILRGRRDSRLYTADDVRAAWGSTGEQPVVLAGTPRRRRGALLAGGPAARLARQLEALSERGNVRVDAVPFTRGNGRTAAAFVDELVGELTAEHVPAAVVSAGTAPTPPPRVQVDVVSPLLPLREWRRIAHTTNGVVLVLEPGGARQEDLDEFRSVLEATDVRLLAVVLQGRRRGRRHRRAAATGTARTQDRPTVPSPRELVPVPDRVG